MSSSNSPIAVNRVLEPSVDALLANALQSFDTDRIGARLRLAAAINRGVDRSMVTAVLAKSIERDEARAALNLLKSAIEHDPQSITLWSQYWQILANNIETNGSESNNTEANNTEANNTHPDLCFCDEEDWQATLAHRLRWLNQGAELRAILKLLDTLDAQTRNSTRPSTTPRYLGYCRWDATREVIEGWALDRWALHDACSLTIQRLDSAGFTGSRQGQLVADNPVDWLAKAGISAVGGFVIRVPVAKDPLAIQSLALRFADGQELVGSPLACGSRIEAWTDEARTDKVPVTLTDSNPQQRTDQSSVVDVLVPVYEGREHTLACINSLIKARHQQATPHDIVVLDDASQDPVLLEALQDFADKGDIVLVRRPANLGFIRNINRGMALHTDRDVVWLNADTRVTGNWLDRLRSAAYASDNTASATPWSNDGEFMTLAGKTNREPMPSQEAQEQIDTVIGELNLAPEELVVGCGFCFYVKRKAIDAVGYLDETHLIDGYGEETDWCLRARQIGWRHVGATNLFVGHAGGQSFGPRKRALAAHNNAIIGQRYPLAKRLHDDYLKQDPLRSARQQIARARFERRAPTQNQTISIKREVSVAQKKQSQELQDKLPAVTDHDIELVWQITGTDTAVTLSLKRMQPLLQLNYRLPQDSEQLAKDLLNLREELTLDAPVAASATHQMPSALVKVLRDTLDLIKTDQTKTDQTKTKTNQTNQTNLTNQPRQVNADAKEARLAKKSSSVPVQRLVPVTGPETAKAPDSLALIVDDLQDAGVVQAWLNAIRTADHALKGIRFITTQNTPGAQLLRRTGRVAPMFCPEGLTWKQWLGLLNVTCAVTLMPETAFIDEIETELQVKLPLVHRKALIPVEDLELETT